MSELAVRLRLARHHHPTSTSAIPAHATESATLGHNRPTGSGHHHGGCALSSNSTGCGHSSLDSQQRKGGERRSRVPGSDDSIARTCIYYSVRRLASVPGLPLNCAGVGKANFPTPAQLKRARKGKAWNLFVDHVNVQPSRV